MSTQPILKRLGTAAKDYWAGVKSLPVADEAAGLRAVAENVNAPEAKTESPSEHGEQPHAESTPATRYGSRPGEKRFEVDSHGNLNPIQETPAEAPQAGLKQLPVYDNGGDVAVAAGRKAQAEGDARIQSLINSPDTKPAVQDQGPTQPAKFVGGKTPSDPNSKYETNIKGAKAPEWMPAIGGLNTPDAAAPAMPLQPLNAPVYDKGGDVQVVKPESSTTETEKKSAPKEDIHEHMDVDTGKPSSSLPPLVQYPKPTQLAPLYDDGGDVDVNDGKHQVAVLQDGEKVLTPEEAERYRAEHKEQPQEEKGPPVDFSGPILPNPTGIKPVLDTEYQKPSDTDRLPTGVKVNIDKAPLKTPDGDISNPLPADIKPETGREISAKTLKPYSQVVDEKAKAAQQVNNPGVQTITSDVNENQVQPKEERGTPEERKAIETDKQKAMGQGVDGFVNLGTALIHENSLTPTKELNQGAEDKGAMEGGLKAPQGTNQGGPGLPPIGGPEASAAAAPVAPGQPGLKPIAPAATPAPMDHKAKLKQYDQQIQSALDEGTPEGQEKADRLQLAKQNFEKNTPWGSETNHPGILGKLGHIGENIASHLPIVGNVMRSIPGTTANRAIEHNQTLGQMDKDTALATQRAAEENKPEKQGIAPATATQIADYQQRITNSGLTGKALETYKNAPAGSTVAELDKRFDEATKLRGMNQKDADTQVAEQDRKDRAQVAADNREQNRTDKLAKAYYTYTDKDGTHVTTGDKLDDLPEDAQLLPVKDLSGLLGEGRAMNAVQDSLNGLHKDLDEHPEVFDNAAARAIVQTTTEQMNRVAATMLIAGTGGAVPLPSGLGDMINTALQNNTLDAKTSKAVKDYIADYKAAKDKALTIQMQMQNGKMGRGGQQAFESIVNQFPGGSTPDSATALRQMAALQKTASTLTSKYPEQYADYTKVKPYEPKSKAAEIPQGTTHTGVSSVDGKTYYLDAQGRKLGPAPEKK